jgi:hypothetical protein
MDIKPENILLIADLGLAKVFALEKPGAIYPYNPTCTFNCISQAPYTTTSSARDYLWRQLWLRSGLLGITHYAVRDARGEGM